MSNFLGNLFKKIPSVVYETSLDGSIVKKVFDPSGKEVSEDVSEFHNSSGGIFAFLGSLFPAKPLKDNGREYNSASGNWEYTAEANGNANPCQCNYEAPQDYQGSVPVWDGYSGE